MFSCDCRTKALVLMKEELECRATLTCYVHVLAVLKAPDVHAPCHPHYPPHPRFRPIPTLFYAHTSRTSSRFCSCPCHQSGNELVMDSNMDIVYTQAMC